MWNSVVQVYIQVIGMIYTYQVLDTYYRVAEDCFEVVSTVPFFNAQWYHFYVMKVEQ